MKINFLKMHFHILVFYEWNGWCTGLEKIYPYFLVPAQKVLMMEENLQRAKRFSLWHTRRRWSWNDSVKSTWRSKMACSLVAFYTTFALFCKRSSEKEIIFWQIHECNIQDICPHTCLSTFLFLFSRLAKICDNTSRKMARHGHKLDNTLWFSKGM